MNAAVVMNVIIDNVQEMNEYFTDVAMGDGLAPLLVFVGTLLIVFSVGVFGALTLGAVGNVFTSN
ncbi:hypothetical protein [Natronococcus occultus]|uniref:Uncharacterized protein n=1 Tax=Natronococcus occultus SP4 TaxID=694430 RepID=L0JZR9_9EURY|nr:hypothetical protein [Natronococcus occultus]AGB38256.1 hypothetical protein Natoc_2483 [Natronococcus occultus SP4]